MFLECFPPLEARWRPVTESRLRADLCDDRIVLSGKVDLTVGRADGLRAGKVLLDLKTGGFAPAHREDLRFYALLETLRTRHAAPPGGLLLPRRRPPPGGGRHRGRAPQRARAGRAAAPRPSWSCGSSTEQPVLKAGAAVPLVPGPHAPATQGQGWLERRDDEDGW